MSRTFKKFNITELSLIAGIGLSVATSQLARASAEFSGEFPAEDIKYEMDLTLPQPKEEISKMATVFQGEDYAYVVSPGTPTDFASFADGVFASINTDQLVVVKFNTKLKDEQYANRVYRTEDGYLYNGITKSGMSYAMYFDTCSPEDTKKLIDKVQSKLGNGAPAGRAIASANWSSTGSCPASPTGLEKMGALSGITSAVVNPLTKGLVVGCAMGIGAQVKAMTWDTGKNIVHFLGHVQEDSTHAVVGARDAFVGGWHEVAKGTAIKDTSDWLGKVIGDGFINAPLETKAHVTCSVATAVVGMCVFPPATEFCFGAIKNTLDVVGQSIAKTTGDTRVLGWSEKVKEAANVRSASKMAKKTDEKVAKDPTVMAASAEYKAAQKAVHATGSTSSEGEFVIRKSASAIAERAPNNIKVVEERIAELEKQGGHQAEVDTLKARLTQEKGSLAYAQSVLAKTEHTAGGKLFDAQKKVETTKLAATQKYFSPEKVEDAAKRANITSPKLVYQGSNPETLRNMQTQLADIQQSRYELGKLRDSYLNSGSGVSGKLGSLKKVYDLSTTNEIRSKFAEITSKEVRLYDTALLQYKAENNSGKVAQISTLLTDLAQKQSRIRAIEMRSKEVEEEKTADQLTAEGRHDDAAKHNTLADEYKAKAKQFSVIANRRDAKTTLESVRAGMKAAEKEAPQVASAEEDLGPTLKKSLAAVEVSMAANAAEAAQLHSLVELLVHREQSRLESAELVEKGTVVSSDPEILVAAQSKSADILQGAKDSCAAEK